MPADALSEMARTGALLVRDQVREGPDGEWRPAQEVTGLFDEQTPSLGLLSSTLEDLFAPGSSPASESAAVTKANRRASTKAGEAPCVAESVELEIAIEPPLIAPPTASSHESDRVNVTAAIPAEPSGLTELAPPPQVFPVWEASAAPAQRWRQPAAASRHVVRHRARTWIAGGIATAALLGAVAAWWYWPRQRTDIYASYVAIYAELQQRRESAQDRDDWPEFAERAKSQLHETLLWLEERATPGDREKSLLLYAGRDLQDLLDLPRNSRNPHQKRLSVFFEQLQEIYGSR